MPYKELNKLSYGDRETYRAVYEQRFSADNTVRLDFDVAGSQAFFVQCGDVVELTYQILKMDKDIYALRIQLPQIALEQYSRRCLIDEIVVTNHIEGVHSSRKEIGAALSILEKQSSKKGRRNVFLGLVNKYRKLLSQEKVPLQTCRDIRDIYDEIVLEEVVSEDARNAPDGLIFRKDMTEVYAATGKSVHKGKYPESEIISYTEKALAFLNDDSVVPLYRICLFHYMLGFIHPFYDGNGRLGRFILSYCVSENFERLLAYRLSETIKENLRRYYAAFATCNDSRNLADLTPFLIMMLTMIRTAMEDLKRSLEEKLADLEHFRAISSDTAGSREIEGLCDVLIQASLFGEKGISAAELQSLLGASGSTIARRLAVIKERALLKTETHEGKKYYSLDLEKLDSLFPAPRDL